MERVLTRLKQEGWALDEQVGRKQGTNTSLALRLQRRRQLGPPAVARPPLPPPPLFAGGGSVLAGCFPRQRGT